MGMYNLLSTSMVCPHCTIEGAFEIELRLGFRDLRNLKMGDLYPWHSRKSVPNGGRPEEGTIDGEGYTECPSCSRAVSVVVRVQEDKVIGVEIGAQELRSDD